MPKKLICCISLPPATISSVPIHDFAEANEELADEEMYGYYYCCGKLICAGCLYSFRESGNIGTCPFCNSDRSGKTDEERVEDMMRRVEAKDAASICLLADSYRYGLNGLQQDERRAMELWTTAVALGSSEARCLVANVYDQRGDMKKAKFYFEAAAMAGHEIARYNLGCIEADYENMERAVKHWTIAASGGEFDAMHNLLVALKNGYVSTESIDSTLTAYNNSCADMRSEARDARICAMIERLHQPRE
jgi:TPR repeat protein